MLSIFIMFSHDQDLFCSGKESHAMEAFANALRQLPSIIAENGGYDSAQLVSELRALHATGKNTMGLNMNEVRHFIRK